MRAKALAVRWTRFDSGAEPILGKEAIMSTDAEYLDEADTDPPPGEHDPDAVEQLAAVLHEADRRAWVEFGSTASVAGLGWPWEDLEESGREPVRFRARCLLDQFDLISKG